MVVRALLVNVGCKSFQDICNVGAVCGQPTSWFAGVLRSEPSHYHGYVDLRAAGLILLVCLSGCSWFHRTKPPPPQPPELVVTGVPKGSTLFVDGVQVDQPSDGSNRARIIQVSPGTHTLEVKMGDTVAYRENAYVGMGDRRAIAVLSGNSRN